MASGTSVTPLPALALINAAGMVERTTEEFARRCNGAADLIESDPQIEQVLAGQADRAELRAGSVQLEVQSVRRHDGQRQVLLSAHADEPDSGPFMWSGDLDASPALVWMKDLDGRYLQVNRRYTEMLSTSPDRLVGHTDRELPAAEVVDGPRLLVNGRPADEPLQLEYTIAPFEHRPALAVLRFPVRDEEGDPVAVCGVAAPLGEAHLARAECTRLMRLERWSRLEPEMVRREVLEEWGVIDDSAATEPPADAGTSEPDPPNADLEQALAQRDAALEERDALTAQMENVQRELGEGKRRIAALHEASATAARRAHELMGALTQEQERSAELQRNGQDGPAQNAELQQAREEADELRSQLQRERELADAARPARLALQKAQSEAKQAQYELQQAQASLQRTRGELLSRDRDLRQALDDLTATREELEDTRERAVQPWPAAAQRALSAALSGASEWRTGLKDVIKVLGREGGWETATAWAPGERSTLRCVAMWTRDPDRRAGFETLTWQRPEPLAGTELGRAYASARTIAVHEPEASDDHRLRLAADEGMRTGLLVPIRDGVESLGLIELLGDHPGRPRPDLLVAMDAVSLQLGHFAHLLRLAARPHWRFGRV
jgi:PAS domain-containing protein